MINCGDPSSLCPLHSDLGRWPAGDSGPMPANARRCQRAPAKPAMIVGEGKQRKPDVREVPVRHTERATEVPRNSGHPPGDRGCPVSGTSSGGATLTPTRLGDLGWILRRRWRGSSRGSRSPVWRSWWWVRSWPSCLRRPRFAVSAAGPPTSAPDRVSAGRFCWAWRS